MEDTTDSPQIQQSASPHKGLIAVLIALVLLSLGSTAYLGYQNMQLTKQLAKQTTIIPTPTPDPTADWETVNGKTFSIKIPPTWKQNFITVNYQDELCFQTERETTMEAGGDFTPGSAELCIRTNVKTDPYKLIDEQVKTVTIDGTAGQQRSGYGGVAGSVYNIQTTVKSNDGNTYEFVFWTQDESLKQIFQKEYDQILSTFTFTTTTVTQAVKPCVNKDLHVTLNIPTDWICKTTEEPGAGWINITSSVFTIDMSNLGRGPYCSRFMGGQENPSCVVTNFYSNVAVGISLDLFKSADENKEIYGQSKGGWVSIKWQDMEKRDLTASEKAQLITVLNSLTFTN